MSSGVGRHATEGKCLVLLLPSVCRSASWSRNWERLEFPHPKHLVLALLQSSSLLPWIPKDFQPKQSYLKRVELLCPALLTLDFFRNWGLGAKREGSHWYCI